MISAFAAGLVLMATIHMVAKKSWGFALLGAALFALNAFFAWHGWAQ